MAADRCDRLCRDLPRVEAIRHRRAENLVGHHLRPLRDAAPAAARRERKTVVYSPTAGARELLESDHLQAEQA